MSDKSGFATIGPHNTIQWAHGTPPPDIQEGDVIHIRLVVKAAFRSGDATDSAYTTTTRTR